MIEGFVVGWVCICENIFGNLILKLNLKSIDWVMVIVLNGCVFVGVFYYLIG